MICEKCGADIPDDSDYCLRCGTDLRSDAVMAEASEQQPVDTTASTRLGIVLSLIGMILGCCGFITVYCFFHSFISKSEAVGQYVDILSHTDMITGPFVAVALVASVIGCILSACKMNKKGIVFSVIGIVFSSFALAFFITLYAISQIQL